MKWQRKIFALLSFCLDSDNLIMEILLEEKSGKVSRETLFGDGVNELWVNGDYVMPLFIFLTFRMLL